MMLVFKVVTYVVKILRQLLSSRGDIINWNFRFKSRYENTASGYVKFLRIDHDSVVHRVPIFP